MQDIIQFDESTVRAQKYYQPVVKLIHTDK